MSGNKETLVTAHYRSLVALRETRKKYPTDSLLVLRAEVAKDETRQNLEALLFREVGQK